MSTNLCICREHDGPHPTPLLSMGLSDCAEIESVREDTSEDGRRMWRVKMADGTEEIVVELREAI